MAIAFLKGQREAASGERKGRLYMRPPEDPLVTKSGCFREAELFDIVGNVHGLANAPYLFSKVFREKVAQCGFQEHSFDCITLMFHDAKSGEFMTCACFHVDDMLLAVHLIFFVPRPPPRFSHRGEWT